MGRWSPRGSVAKFDFKGKIRKPGISNSMPYRHQSSRKSNFATEPHQVPQGAPHELEQQADRFAEAFLLPAAAMREALVPPITLTTLADLKARWGVSLQALIRRARTLEIITPSQYRSLSAQLGARGWRTQEPIAVPVERPRALRQLAELLYGHPIETPRLADAMGLDPSFIQDLLEAHAAG